MASEHVTSPVVGDIASFDKDGLKRTETEVKNPLPSSAGMFYLVPLLLPCAGMKGKLTAS